MAAARKKSPRRAGKPKETDTRAFQNGQDGTVQIPLEGAAELDRPGIEVVEGPGALAYAEEMAFMEEKVVVVVHESSDKNAEDPVLLSVNGRVQLFQRGRETICKRKYVERMARAKEVIYTQNLEETDPEMYNRLKQRTGLKYPFSLVADPNPKAGAPWLKKLLAEA